MRAVMPYAVGTRHRDFQPLPARLRCTWPDTTGKGVQLVQLLLSSIMLVAAKYHEEWAAHGELMRAVMPCAVGAALVVINIVSCCHLPWEMSHKRPLMRAVVSWWYSFCLLLSTVSIVATYYTTWPASVCSTCYDWLHQFPTHSCCLLPCASGALSLIGVI